MARGGRFPLSPRVFFCGKVVPAMHIINRIEGFRDLAGLPGRTGREPCQGFWHPWIAQFTQGFAVLDVGSGISTIKVDLVTYGAKSVETQDPCEWCPTDTHTPVEELARNGPCADVVTCLDVMEHVVNYGAFARDLVRLATKRVIITTPGVGVTKNANVHHYHEFYPNEVVQLFTAAGAKLEAVRFYFNGEKSVKDAAWNLATELAAKEFDVHPLGFVFHI